MSNNSDSIKKNNFEVEFNTLTELANLSLTYQVPISELIKKYENQNSELEITVLETEMDKHLTVMQESIAQGLQNPQTSLGGLIGGEGKQLEEYMVKNTPVSGNLTSKALARALAVSEVNASMGKVVASPTAGACGIIPGVLITIGEERNCDNREICNAMFTASGVGIVVSEHATLAGAEGGCQAECGVGSAMAAAGAVEMLGGTPEQVLNAVAISLKGILGLVCDPVAGLVEVPCQKRNTMAVAQALTSIDMALAGIPSVIPADEVISAMYEIGKSIPPALRETAEGGLATTPTGQQIMDKLDQK